MKKKFDFSSYIAKYWWYFALWMLFVILIWVIVFSFITKPKKEESIYLFFGVEKAQTDLMYEDFKNDKPEYVKNIDITVFSTRTDAFDSLFATRGLLNTDVFVLPETYCEPSAMKALFYPVDRSVMKELFGEDVEFDKAAYEDKVYGIKLYDKETDVGKATSYFTYTYYDDAGVKQAVGNYYLFFSKESLHLGGLSGSEADGAIVLAQAILNKAAE